MQLEMTKQASLWVFRGLVTFGVIPKADLRLLAFVASCLSSFGVPSNDIFNRVLLDFYGGSPYFASLNLSHWQKTLDGDTCLWRCALRSFSRSFVEHRRLPRSRKELPARAMAYCRRSFGSLVSLDQAESYFVEERKMIVGYLRTFNDSRPPTFSIAVLDDRWPSSGDTGERYINWEEQGFVVQGLNAGHHLLQCTLFAALHEWVDQWLQCLDWLDSVVKIELEDIMNHNESERLMFDSSFERSRIYFKTLQVLRIFSQTVKSTRRAVYSLAPERIPKVFSIRTGATRPFIHPNTIATDDKILMANWKILWSYYLESEKQLLQQIAEKTEEIKSLRDGLFNATSLREASRSTTMNRYVIVFTIVTVLYLPPSLIASVFGTELFTTEDTEETIGRFKTSTVVVSMSTYIFALLLIWLADRLEYPRIMLRKAKAWGTMSTRRVARLFRLEKIVPDWFSDTSSTSSSASSDIWSDDDSGSRVSNEAQGEARDQAPGMFRRYFEALTSSKKKTEAV
ncbi:hypothetical protein QBC34DRAFT_412658 [Podospora aff. communis PSN243]|uniref:Uncharacterized protein n=1 Tax=Podospora aff. communis PSN243 TaxID=3040156 RepID=A0AAV9GEK9_9PEZI|nr:hypothetical protein QBC34DRAFT_412658 [Podospora aff. communis PSN243]